MILSPAFLALLVEVSVEILSGTKVTLVRRIVTVVPPTHVETGTFHGRKCQPLRCFRLIPIPTEYSTFRKSPRNCLYGMLFLKRKFVYVCPYVWGQKEWKWPKPLQKFYQVRSVIRCLFSNRIFSICCHFNFLSICSFLG